MEFKTRVNSVMAPLTALLNVPWLVPLPTLMPLPPLLLTTVSST
jgi:hypothetical protein